MFFIEPNSRKKTYSSVLWTGNTWILKHIYFKKKKKELYSVGWFNIENLGRSPRGNKHGALACWNKFSAKHSKSP